MVCRPPGRWTSREVVASLPPLVLVSGSLLSWAWHGLGLGGGIGSLQPPTLLVGSLVITGALLGLAGSRPFRHLSWGAFALSTISLLTVVGMFDGADLVGNGGGADTTLVASLFYLGWLVLAITLAVAIGGREGLRSPLFLALFLAGAVTHFPIFEAQEIGVSAEVASRATAALAAAALVESAAVAWVVVRWSQGAEKLAFWVLVAILLLHPILTAWRVTLGSAEGLSAYLQTVVGGGVSLALLLGVTFLFHRFSLALRRGLR